jgi:hypothetical protein
MIVRYSNTYEAAAPYHSQRLPERDRYAGAIVALVEQMEASRGDAANDRGRRVVDFT